MTAQPANRSSRATYDDLNHFADVDMPSDQFAQAVRAAVPGRTWNDDELDAVRDDVQWLFGKAVGQFNWSEYRTSRKTMIARLKLLQNSLGTAAEILQSSVHSRTTVDTDVLRFIADVGISRANDNPKIIFEEMAACHAAVEAMLNQTIYAQGELAIIKGAGKPSLLWYEPIVAAATLLANHLQIPLITGGNRSYNKHETLFTRLTFGLERFLPPEMQSANFAACAKRVERSASWVKTKKSKKIS